MKLILGSQSVGRRKIAEQLARELGMSFESFPPSIDERSIRDPDPRRLVLRLTQAKADALRARLGSQSAILLTGDQVVTWRGEIREKPTSEDQARAWLRDYRHSTVGIVSGVEVTNLKSGQQASGVEVARVTFGDIPDTVIDALISRQDGLNCSGALRAQNPIIKPYETASDLTDDRAVGLPIELTSDLIRQVCGIQS